MGPKCPYGLFSSLTMYDVIVNANFKHICLCHGGGGVNPKITKITEKRPFWTHHTSYMTDLKIYSQSIIPTYNTACVKIIHAPFNLLLEGHFYWH